MWDIEVFFKACKSIMDYSYDALTAHVAIVFTRYMLLAVSRLGNEYDRTLDELLYIMIAEVADMTYQESLLIIVETILAIV